HLAHHKFLGLPRDTKRLYRRDVRGLRLGLEIVRGLSGADYVQHAIETLVLENDDRRREHRSPHLDLVPLMVTQAILIGLFALVDVRLYLLLWVVPLLTVSISLGKLRSIVEHHNDAGASIVTRSLRVRPLEYFFFARLNFNYHSEHHLYPDVSYQYLPLVQERLIANGEQPAPMERHDSGYLATLWRLCTHRFARE